jgi:hypothetical protein
MSKKVTYNVLAFLFVLTFLPNTFFFASSTWQTGIDTGDFYGGNIERVSGLHSYSMGQVCLGLINLSAHR